LGITAHNGNFCNREVNESLLEKMYYELNARIAEEAIDEEVDEPEFDSAGFSKEDRYPMHECWCGSYETCDCISEPHDNDGRNSHYVSNEEADEDANLPKLGTKQFNDMASAYFGGAPKLKTKERGWIAQAILDYVDEVGAASYTEMNEFYKAITLGSNSFTHILQNLRIPYKNRKTQRYLAKEGRGGSNAKWVVKVANPSNWVVVSEPRKNHNDFDSTY
jgi:hypothetical protein